MPNARAQSRQIQPAATAEKSFDHALWPSHCINVPRIGQRQLPSSALRVSVGCEVGSSGLIAAVMRQALAVATRRPHGAPFTTPRQNLRAFATLVARNPHDKNCMIVVVAIVITDRPLIWVTGPRSGSSRSPRRRAR
jgi:hypothetical protein